MLFWNERDLKCRLTEFMDYYNCYRAHRALDGSTPPVSAAAEDHKTIHINNYRWQSHCRGLYQTPMSAYRSTHQGQMFLGLRMTANLASQSFEDDQMRGLQ